MDRRRRYGAVGGETVRAGGSFSIELLLHADGDGERGEAGVDAPDRRVVPEAPVLRLSAYHRLVAGVGLACEREARGAADAGDGFTGSGSWAPYKPASSGGSEGHTSVA